jgi:hypothetical protein
MVIMCTQPVFGDVEVSHEEFAIDESAEGIHETGFAFPDRFDLGTGKLNACNIFFEEEVLEISLLVFDADGFGKGAHDKYYGLANIG